MENHKVVKGETETGFVFEIQADAFDDYELIEDMAALSENNMTVLPRILERLLGTRQTAALKEHCRDKETGRVPFSAIDAEVSRIFAKVPELKK